MWMRRAATRPGRKRKGDNWRALAEIAGADAAAALYQSLTRSSGGR